MSNQFRVIAVALGASVLSACSSSAPVGPSAAATNTTPAPIPAATTAALSEASLHGGTPVLASGSSPNFSTSPPAAGTLFPLNDSIALSTPHSGTKGDTVTAYNPSSGTVLIFEGSQIVNGVVRNTFGVKQPSLSIDTQNAGGNVTLSDGRTVSVGSVLSLNYAVLGWWTQRPAPGPLGGPTYWGYGTGGYQTPVSGVPTSGTASYTGGGSQPGGVFGTEYVPVSGGGISNATLSGQVQVNVNFATGGITGSLTNMTAIIEGDFDPATPWNNIALSGSLSGATMRGTTAVTNAPGNPLSMASGATGTFSGALYGPNAQELGAAWTLYDPTGNGKTAVGVIGATKP